MKFDLTQFDGSLEAGYESSYRNDGVTVVGAKNCITQMTATEHDAVGGLLKAENSLISYPPILRKRSNLKIFGAPSME